MANMLLATVDIQGTRALLWHHFGPDAIPLEKGERTGVAGNDPMEWHRTVLVTKDGQLYLESSYIFACVRDGARYVKKGRGSIQSAVSATLQVEDDFILVDRYLPPEPLPSDPTAPVYLDIRSVRNPATKGRNIRYRVAASAGWAAQCRLAWDKTIVSRSEMESAVRDAGRLAGLGSGRAIGFGRFDVTSFAVGDA